MTARLLVGHQRPPDRMRIEIVVLGIDQDFGIGFVNTGKEALAHQAP